MSINRRIWIFQFVVVFAVLTMAAAVFFGVQASNDYISRAQLSRQQLEATMQLAVHANRFSEQIAELLLIGEPERPDFESARNQTSAAISDLLSITQQEIEFIQDPHEKAEEQREVERLNQMRWLFHEIDRAVERVLLLEQQGRKQEAISLFRSEIENRLDAEFEKLIAAAVADERDKVGKADLAARTLSRRWMIGVLALLGVSLVIAIASGLLLGRSLKTPIQALADGALAIERGDLDHHIAYSKRDELGLLARRFNAMVDELQRQRLALVEARNHLEREVAERTRELGAANRQLTELDRQRVRFLADVSHELKTPLTVLRGEAEVTLRGASKPDTIYRAALASIVAQAISMGRLIDDLLFLARSEAEEIRFDFRAVPLPRLVLEAVEEASVLARDRDIKVSVDGAGNIPIVRADPRRLKQAVLIVLDNAIKFADSQTRVEVGTCAGNGGHAQVRVRNDGRAIPPDELPFVFERFYRGANTSGRDSNGSGLGLAIARWIIEKHEGSIDLTSSPDDGTEVRIQLPSES